MCYSVGKSLVTIATTGRQPDSGEILSKNYLPIIVPCSAIRYHWPSRFRKTSVWRLRRVLTWPDSRTERGELGVGNRRVAVDADCDIRRLHFHDDDLALDVAQTHQRLVLAFGMPVLAGEQVIGCKMFLVFIPVAANDSFCQLHFQSFDFAFCHGIRVGARARLRG